MQVTACTKPHYMKHILQTYQSVERSNLKSFKFGMDVLGQDCRAIVYAYNYLVIERYVLESDQKNNKDNILGRFRRHYDAVNDRCSEYWVRFFSDKFVIFKISFPRSNCFLEARRSVDKTIEPFSASLITEFPERLYAVIGEINSKSFQPPKVFTFELIH